MHLVLTVTKYCVFLCISFNQIHFLKKLLGGMKTSGSRIETSSISINVQPLYASFDDLSSFLDQYKSRFSYILFLRILEIYQMEVLPLKCSFLPPHLKCQGNVECGVLTVDCPEKVQKVSVNPQSPGVRCEHNDSQQWQHVVVFIQKLVIQIHHKYLDDFTHNPSNFSVFSAHCSTHPSYSAQGKKAFNFFM